MIRTILQMGNPLLRRTADPVTDFTESALQGLIDDLRETASSSGGVGIAAPQIGESVRIALIASQPSERYPQAPLIGPILLVNPVFEWKSEEMEKGWEGCLSIPGIRGIVPRHTKIRVRHNAFPGGAELTSEFEHFIARVVQHEMDHLNGTLYIDRVETPLDLATEQEYFRLITESNSQDVPE
jgi:peptide deformylase